MNAKPSLKQSTILNFVGGVLPMFVALVTTPIYLEHIGAARYGVLAIVWMVQGYFGCFDLGLSSATSNRIAQLADESPAYRESVLWTALALNAGLGIAGALALLAAMQVLLAHFAIGSALTAELLPALPCVACLVPLTNLISVLNGALTGREQFVALNAVQLPVTLLYQLTPLAVAIVAGPSLRYLVLATLGAGVASLVLTFAVVSRVFPIRFARGPRRAFVRQLFSYGAWISVTSLTQPLLETADRLLIGSALGPQAVAYYQVPFNLAGRVRLLPSVVSRTLFPRLSSLDATSAAALSSNAVRSLAAVLTPLCVFGMFLMQPFLSIWVGHAFASKAMGVGEMVLVGVWINSVAYLPSCHLQATGRPGCVARFQAYEIVPFIAFLWWALHAFGVLGAALAWSVRAALDAMLLFWAARLDAQTSRMLWKPAFIVACAYGATLVFAPLSPANVAAWVGLTAAALGWSASAEPKVRANVLAMLSSLRAQARRLAQRPE